jgi:hypothetical protein
MLESLLFDNFNKWTLACNGAARKRQEKKTKVKKERKVSR